MCCTHKHITASIATKFSAAILVFVLLTSFVSKFHYHDSSGIIQSCLIVDLECHNSTHSGDCGHSHDTHDNCALHQNSLYLKDDSHSYCSVHHQHHFCYYCAVISSELYDFQPYQAESQLMVRCLTASPCSAYTFPLHLRAPPVD